jgi:hypothetical protein
VMEGRGSDGGGGNGGAGLSLLTVGTCRPGVGGCHWLYVLAICQWPYMLAIRWWGCSELLFVDGEAHSGCWVMFVGTGFPFVGAELSFVGGEAHSRAVHIRGCWVHVRCTFVGGVHVHGCGAVVCGRVARLCVVW